MPYQESFDLPPAAIRVLAAIYWLTDRGAPGQATGTNRVAERLRCRPPTVSQQLHALDAMGLIARQRGHPGTLRLTEPGRAVVRALQGRKTEHPF
jgi:DNA-binding MarR family transcriptional regulator